MKMMHFPFVIYKKSRTNNPVRTFCYFLVHVIPVLFLIFSTRNVAAQSIECDSIADYQMSEGPSAIDCGGVQVMMHVGTGSGGATTASAAFPSTSTAFQKNIMVSGTFTIDKSFTFDECFVLFNEDAEMVTIGTVDLVGIKSTFTNCEEKAWKSIQISENGAIQFDRCVVTGALNGLDFRKDYRPDQSMIIRSTFHRNLYSIISLEQGTILRFTEFVQNVFWGSQPVPGINILPLSGIRLTGCKAIIGTPVFYNDPSEYQFYVNRFQNLRYGIEAFGSSTKVYVANCMFLNMRPDPKATGVPTGCGINALGVDLTVSAYNIPGSMREIGHCTFINCASAGIRAAGCKLNVSRAFFDGAHVYGINSYATGFRTQTIKHCTFDVGGPICKAGIFLERPNGSGNAHSTSIHTNTFTMFGSVAGVDIRCPVASTDFMSVSGNNITLNGGSPSFGVIIYGGQSNNIELLANSVYCASGGDNSVFGIFLVNLEGVGHLVDGNYSYGKGQCNYHLEKSRNVQYCDNASSGAINGFHFHGDNDNALWSVNEIGGGGRGLFVNNISGVSSGRISKQTRKGNLWEDDDSKYLESAARCDSDPDMSKFLIEDNSPEKLPTKIQPNHGWFFEEQGSTEYCAGTSWPISTFEEELAAGGQPSISDAEEWEATRLLMETILRYPSQLVGDSTLQAFYQQNLTTTAGKFALINKMLEDGGFSTSPLWATRENKEEQIFTTKIILDSLNTRALMSDLDSNNIYYPGDTMLPVVHAEMIALADSIEMIEAILSSIHDTVLLVALASLDSIATTEDYEEAYKLLRTYQIKIALGYEPEDAGYEDLVDVANADETDYGGAVRHARHFLSDCERYIRIAPNEEEEERPLATNVLTLTPVISIIPNPAKSNIRVTQEGLSSGKWIIVSASDILVHSGFWPEGQTSQQISLQSIAPGAYYFIMHSESGHTAVAKLMVIH